MYQVRAEAVNGLQVLSKGRWLTCIGNKPVRKGDLVWTDGRCVYGFYQEGQTPLVIFEEIFHIPILFADYEQSKYYIYSTDKGLEEVQQTGGNIQTLNNYFTEMINDYSSNAYIYSYLPIDSRYDKVADTSAPVAMNIDKQGNRYMIVVTTWLEYNSEQKSTIFTYSNGFNYAYEKTEKRHLKVQVMKNDSVIYEYTNTDESEGFLSEIEQTVTQNTPNFLLVSTHFYTSDCRWGFIENEYNWAFVVDGFISASAYSFLGKLEGSVIGNQGLFTFPPGACQVGFGEYGNMLYTKFCSSQTSKIITKATAYKSASGVFEDSLSDVKFPMQDGYFFKMELSPTDYSDLSLLFTYGESVKTTFYSPQKTPIFTANLPFNSYFSIYKINNSEYLLGASERVVWFFDHPDYIRLDIPSYGLKNYGLFLYKNGELQKLLDGNILNQRLRPMKNYKDWQNRIQTI